MDDQTMDVGGQCHCGAVRFTARLAGGLDRVIRCTCSYCAMRGAVIAFADLANLRILAGEDRLTRYRFHTNAAGHYFCATCGIYTHHQRRFDPTQFAINVACLDGISPFDFADVPVVDGVNHPHDHGGGALRVIGTLRYETVE